MLTIRTLHLRAVGNLQILMIETDGKYFPKSPGIKDHFPNLQLVLSARLSETGLNIGYTVVT